MRPTLLAVCAAAALSPTMASAAAPAGVASDVRCVLAMVALTNSKDAKQAQLATVGVAYFTGRVKAQDPSFNFATGLKPVAAQMSNEVVVSEIRRCGPPLTASLRELDGALKAMAGPKPAAAPPAAAKPAPPKK